MAKCMCGSALRGGRATVPFDVVLARKEELQSAGMRIVNLAGVTDDDKRRLTYFMLVARPATHKHYGVRGCFGRSGSSFARGVPLLAVFDKDGRVEDVYPHRSKDRPDHYVTISDYFSHSDRRN